jgi:hypothetical protein
MTGTPSCSCAATAIPAPSANTVWNPQPVPLAKLIDVAGARWSLLAAVFLAVGAAWQRVRDGSIAALELIPVTVPELLRQLRGTVIPWPRRDKAHRDAWTLWRRRHQYHARRAH